MQYVEMYPPERYVGVQTPRTKTHDLILRSDLFRGNVGPNSIQCYYKMSYKMLLYICICVITKSRKLDIDTGTGKRLWESGGTGWGDAAKVREWQRLPVNHMGTRNKEETLPQFPWKEPTLLTLWSWASRLQKREAVKALLRKKEQTLEVSCTLKLYYKATVIKTVLCWHKKSYTNQGNRVESPEVNPHLYRQLIYDKGESLQWGEDSLFNNWN